MFDYFHKRCDKLQFFSLVLQVLVFVSFLHNFQFVSCSLYLLVWTIHWSFCGCLFVRFYVLTLILMLVYGSHNTVSTFTPVSEAAFLLSERSELINVMCNMFSSTSSPSPMPLCCNTSCQFALYLLPSFSVECPLAACEVVAFKTVSRIQSSCCNHCFYAVICDCTSQHTLASNLECYCVVYLFVFI